MRGHAEGACIPQLAVVPCDHRRISDKTPKVIEVECGMLGHSHALSGAAAGAGVAIATHLRPTEAVGLALLTAGAALLPDLDSCGSCSARSFGWLSRLPALAIRGVSGGHRHATHSVIGVTALYGLAVAAGTYRNDVAGKAGLGLLVALMVAGGLEALRICREHVADTLGVVAGVAVAVSGFWLALVPAAVAAGCIAHLAGDMLTDSGVPLLFPWMQRFRLLPEPLAFRTGTRPELWVVDPLLTVALLGLGAAAAAPAVLHLIPL
ncbi:MAG: metal-dependent hydrolase [Actinobacteria bacterium]|nr:metal-dependent hydrolase [Actinomycetota bacterium]